MVLKSRLELILSEAFNNFNYSKQAKNGLGFID